MGIQIKPRIVPVINIDDYAGNHNVKTISNGSIVLEVGYFGYVSEPTADTTYTINSSAWLLDSTDSSRRGGQFRLFLVMPSTDAPDIDFGSNITFADYVYPELDEWECGKEYVLSFETIDAGTSWLVTDIEVY